eukprot:12936588-Prorocentrum_lima.AAC.1
MKPNTKNRLTAQPQTQIQPTKKRKNNNNNHTLLRAQRLHTNFVNQLTSSNHKNSNQHPWTATTSACAAQTPY